jgi:hypothetical protein
VVPSGSVHTRVVVMRVATRQPTVVYTSGLRAARTVRPVRVAGRGAVGWALPRSQALSLFPHRAAHAVSPPLSTTKGCCGQDGCTDWAMAWVYAGFVRRCSRVCAEWFGCGESRC